MRLSALQTGLLGLLCGVLVVGAGGKTRAQTTGTVPPAPAETSKDQSSSSVKEGPPPGGCMPIGITVSGEVVFPFQCKDFIDRHKADNRNPVVLKDKPDLAQEGGAAKQSEAVAVTPAAKASETLAATPEVKAAETVAATPMAKASESVATPAAATPEVGAAETVAATPTAKAPESVVATPVAKAAVAATPEVGAPETVTPQADKTTRPPLYKTAASKGVGDPSTLAKGPPGCAHFRTYDSASHTYMTFGGQRRPCL